MTNVQNIPEGVGGKVLTGVTLEISGICMAGSNHCTLVDKVVSRQVEFNNSHITIHEPRN